MTYKIELTEQDLQVLDSALSEMPYRVVSSLIFKINQQIAEQQQQKE